MKKRILIPALLSLLAFASIASAYEFLSPLNTAVRSFIGANLYKPFYPAAIFLHYFFETALGTLQTLIWGAVIFFLYKSRSGALLMISVMLTQTTAVNIMKALTRIPRPPQEFFGVFHHNFSYPSGHTCTSFTLAIMLGYIIIKRLGRGEGRIIAAAYAAVALVTAYSRMYLDVHWMLDILGGIFLAGFISLFFIALDQSIRSRRPKTDKMLN